MYNHAFLDKHTIKQAFAPVDLNTAAVTGNRISLAKGQKVTVVIELADSLTGGAVDITLKQHDAASAGNTKVLAVDRPYFKKVGAATSFTKVEATGTAASNFVLSADFDTDPGNIVFEIESQDLDISNGYNHFSVDLADGAVSRIASAIYILSECRNVPAYAVEV
jgi:hypothetical protein